MAVESSNLNHLSSVKNNLKPVQADEEEEMNPMNSLNMSSFKLPFLPLIGRNRYIFSYEP